MEIRVKQVSSETFQNLNFCIPSGRLVAVFGEERMKLLRLLHFEEHEKGSIYLDGVRKTTKNKAFYQKKIALVKEHFLILPFLSTVEEYLFFFLRKYHIFCKNPKKKVQDALRIVGLPLSSFEKSVTMLSKTEQKLLSLALSLLVNPEVLLLEEPFVSLDLVHEKQLVLLFRKLKEKYNKTIIFTTPDVNQIYQYGEDVLFLKKGTMLCMGDVMQIFQQEDFFKKNKIELPDVIQFTNLVREKKNISLAPKKDVRDLIKDIYRNV